MKSLSESLFDKDLIKKDLSIEQLTDKIFNPTELKNLDPETTLSWLNDIWDSSEHYSTQKLKNLNIDILETPIIVRLGKLDSPLQSFDKIIFLFKPDRLRNYIYDFRVFSESYWYKSYWYMGNNQYWNHLQGYKKTLSNLISLMNKNYLEKISWGVIENKILKDKIAKGLKSIYFREKT